MRRFISCVVVLCLTIPLSALSQTGPERMFWTAYGTGPNYFKKLQALNHLCIFYKQQNDVSKGDSVAQIAVNIVRSSENRDAALKAYEAYFDYISSFEHIPDAASQAAAMLQLATECRNNECISKAHAARALVYNNSGDTLNALRSAETAYRYASRMTRDAPLLVNSLLTLGDMQNRSNRTREAYHSYINALHIADSIGSPNLIYACYAHLARFFYLVSDYELAIHYHQLQINQVVATTGDSDRIMALKADIARNLIHSERIPEAERELQRVIDYALAKKNRPLADDAFVSYRSLLIERNRIWDLRRLYTVRYPDEYTRIRLKNKPLLIRLEAFFKEADGDIVAARIYYDSAAKFLPSGDAAKTNFYLRYGQFALRNRDTPTALARLRLAYNYAARSNYLPFILKTSLLLDSLHRMRHQWDSAHRYVTLNKTAFQRWTSARNLDELTVREEEHARQSLEKVVLKQKKRQERIYFSTGLLVLLGTVVVVSNNYRLKSKNNVRLERLNSMLSSEKERSDRLLLNILPYEVAEELKATGSAKAKSFDHVTVLFTDFVTFTKVGERRSPQELVGELDACFKAFDEITDRYQIEKIKTIGDAYLAVAGLPAADPQHALHVIQAAREINAFMDERRARLGADTFEIRIGAHSGSVVAGIVGVKKFAYDIWGDTVNTAARMQECSDPGRINISETTYELVKDQVPCTFRGAIHAKGKGAMPMYFVG